MLLCSGNASQFVVCALGAVRRVTCVVAMQVCNQKTLMLSRTDCIITLFGLLRCVATSIFNLQSVITLICAFKY